MTLEQLIEQFRIDADDRVAPYLWSDDDVTRWLNEAQHEACTRALLIKDMDTLAVCQIPVFAGNPAYALHPSIISITRAAFAPTGQTDEFELHQTDEFELDRTELGWRRRTERPRSYIHNDTKLRLGCLPDSDGTLHIDVQRGPLRDMSNDLDRPEIAQAHHRHLVNWALFRCFGIPDSELLDKGRAQAAEALFAAYFGVRPDANARRGHQTNRKHHNTACWMG
jgi:hypothetical protein